MKKLPSEEIQNTINILRISYGNIEIIYRYWLANIDTGTGKGLYDLVNKQILVRLKWGIEYKGKLASFDKYMNIQLLETEEIIDNKIMGTLGEILIRCNNILFIREYIEK